MWKFKLNETWKQNSHIFQLWLQAYGILSTVGLKKKISPRCVSTSQWFDKVARKNDTDSNWFHGFCPVLIFQSFLLSGNATHMHRSASGLDYNMDDGQFDEWTTVNFTIKSFESFDNAIPLYRVLSTDEWTENDDVFHLTTSNKRKDRKGGWGEGGQVHQSPPCPGILVAVASNFAWLSTCSGCCVNKA